MRYKAFANFFNTFRNNFEVRLPIQYIVESRSQPTRQSICFSENDMTGNEIGASSSSLRKQFARVASLFVEV